jgi:cytochrome c oxidase subunit IV
MPQEHVAEHSPRGRYLWTWLGLLALTFLSFGVSFAHIGEWEMAIALAIAVAKSALVLLFFMHLVEQKFMNAFAILVAVGMLVLLLSITMVDVLSRHTFPPAPLEESLPPPPDLHAPSPGGAGGPLSEPVPIVR